MLHTDGGNTLLCTLPTAPVCVTGVIYKIEKYALICVLGMHNNSIFMIKTGAHIHFWGLIFRFLAQLIRNLLYIQVVTYKVEKYALICVLGTHPTESVCVTGVTYKVARISQQT